MIIHIGTSGFAYKEWKGKFYPAGIAPEEMLHFYAEHFSSVEINNTFYRMPTERLLRSWAGQVPGDFVFGFKAPRVITHLKRLRDAHEEVAYLFRVLSSLGERLGPVLFQLPGSFHADLTALRDFLSLIPDGVACAFEFRSPTWLADDILGLLRSRKGCLCTADTDGNPAEGILPTASWGYLRLRRSDYAEADLAQWFEQIRKQKWERAFVFFKHEEGARGAEAAERFQELVVRRSGGRRPARVTA
jgi:uncharacterized protein YecE (DUF72 family)